MIERSSPTTSAEVAKPTDPHVRIVPKETCKSSARRCAKLSLNEPIGVLKKNKTLLINRPKIRMSNIFFIVLYLSLIYPQKGCEKIEARGPTANTQPISVPFSPLYCK